MTTNEIEKVLQQLPPLRDDVIEVIRNTLTTLTAKCDEENRQTYKSTCEGYEDQITLIKMNHEKEKRQMLDRIENLLRVGADPLTATVLERAALSKTDVTATT